MYYKAVAPLVVWSPKDFQVASLLLRRSTGDSRLMSSK